MSSQVLESHGLLQKIDAFSAVIDKVASLRVNRLMGKVVNESIEPNSVPLLLAIDKLEPSLTVIPAYIRFDSDTEEDEVEDLRPTEVDLGVMVRGYDPVRLSTTANTLLDYGHRQRQGDLVDLAAMQPAFNNEAAIVPRAPEQVEELEQASITSAYYRWFANSRTQVATLILMEFQVHAPVPDTLALAGTLRTEDGQYRRLIGVRSRVGNDFVVYILHPLTIKLYGEEAVEMITSLRGDPSLPVVLRDDFGIDIQLYTLETVQRDWIQAVHRFKFIEN